jgi:hypothetical protein
MMYVFFFRFLMFSLKSSGSSGFDGTRIIDSVEAGCKDGIH